MDNARNYYCASIPSFGGVVLEANGKIEDQMSERYGYGTYEDLGKRVTLLGAALLIGGTFYELGHAQTTDVPTAPKSPSTADTNLFYYGGNLAPTTSTCLNQLEVRIDNDNNIYVCSPKVTNTWTKLSGAAIAQ